MRYQSNTPQCDDNEAVTRYQDSMTFYLDSGSDEHICTNKELLTNLRPCKEKLKTALSGVSVEFRLKGDLRLFSEEGKEIILKDVLFNENSVNLISVRKLIKEKYEVAFGKKNVVMNSRMEILCETNDELQVTLYSKKSDLKKPKRKKLSVKGYLKLHALLGHPSDIRLREFLKRFTHFKFPSEVPNFCIGCSKGKTTSKNVPKHSRSNEAKATGTFQRLYADTMGPINPKSIEGFTGMVLVTDYFSRF